MMITTMAPEKGHVSLRNLMKTEVPSFITTSLARW